MSFFKPRILQNRCSVLLLNIINGSQKPVTVLNFKRIFPLIKPFPKRHSILIFAKKLNLPDLKRFHLQMDYSISQVLLHLAIFCTEKPFIKNLHFWSVIINLQPMGALLQCIELYYIELYYIEFYYTSFTLSN